MKASGSMSMSGGSHGISHTGAISMGGMPMHVSSGGTNILPSWLAVLCTLMFLGIAITHAWHVHDTHRERRVWHGGHVVMAIGMMFMFAPPSLDHFGIPAEFWRLLFANVSGALVIYILVWLTLGQPVNRLWLILAIDMAAMVYMWSPAGFVPVITWILVGYFAIQSVLWFTDSYRRLERPPLVAPVALTADGAVVAESVQPLVCEHDLRLSMGLMVLGMAYMFAAMQLVM